MTSRANEQSERTTCVSILQKCDYDKCNWAFEFIFIWFQFYKSAIMTRVIVPCDVSTPDVSILQKCDYDRDTLRTLHIRIYVSILQKCDYDTIITEKYPTRICVSILQKCDYDSRMLHIPISSGGFQFYKSAIMTHLTNRVIQPSATFQFYKSAIMTNALKLKIMICEVSILQKCDYDPIASVDCIVTVEFQFYKSAIMTYNC